MVCRLVVADDHPLFRDALRLAVSRALPDAQVVEANSFDSLRDRLEATPDADLVLLDLNMPGMAGLSGLLFLRAEFPAVAVAIISANEEPSTIRQALALGATGYIPKSATLAEIQSALAALLAGQTWAPARFDWQRRGPGDEATLLARLARLTPQQIRVLMMLSDGSPNKRIAYALGVSEATIKAHVSAVLEKLGVDNRTQAVIIAQRLMAAAVAADAAEDAVGLEVSR